MTPTFENIKLVYCIRIKNSKSLVLFGELYYYYLSDSHNEIPDRKMKCGSLYIEVDPICNEGIWISNLVWIGEKVKRKMTNLLEKILSFTRFLCQLMVQNSKNLTSSFILTFSFYTLLVLD